MFKGSPLSKNERLSPSVEEERSHLISHCCTEIVLKRIVLCMEWTRGIPTQQAIPNEKDGCLVFERVTSMEKMSRLNTSYKQVMLVVSKVLHKYKFLAQFAILPRTFLGLLISDWLDSHLTQRAHFMRTGWNSLEFWKWKLGPTEFCSFFFFAFT